MKQPGTTLDRAGRILIPAKVRKAMGIKPGDRLVLRLEDEELRISSLDRAIRRAQEIVRKYNPTGRSLVDELIAERRAEAGRE
jgi:AbrB family looped-hinge helix DNA binding protein